MDILGGSVFDADAEVSAIQSSVLTRTFLCQVRSANNSCPALFGTCTSDKINGAAWLSLHSFMHSIASAHSQMFTGWKRKFVSVMCLL